MKKVILLCSCLIVFVSESYGQFIEGFESGIPATWTVINGGDANTWFSGVAIGGSHSGTKSARIDYTDAIAHDDFLITQQFTVTAGVSDRLSTWARNYSATYLEEFDILLSTTDASAASFTTTIATSVIPATTWGKYSYSLSAYVGQTVYVAFRSTTTEKYQLFLDDIQVDAIQVLAPSCATNLIATTNTCGNLTTVLSWDPVTIATGYKLTVGTTPGGTNVLNNQDIGLITSYFFPIQNPNTTYYWTVVPYNLAGIATGCTQNMYATKLNTCYCTPFTGAVDGFGIVNVTLGSINNTTRLEPTNYGNYSDQIANTSQGTSQSIAITLNTDAYSYFTNVWVDWNNDIDFEDAGELMYSGISGTGINTQDISFNIPVAATAGNHRLRIGCKDLNPIDPCYTGNGFGVFEDYTLNVLPSLGTQSFDLNGFSVYPNPVIDVLNLSYITAISKISVLNLLGQEVIALPVNVAQSKIDMSGLSSGTYLVKITIGDIVNTIKVIKE
jgi:hypothetical protein